MDKKKRTLKICFAASSGGHFDQLMMLRPLMEQHDSFIVTEKTAYETNVQGIKMYYMVQVNREEISCVLKLLVNTFKSLRLYFAEKPDVIICTGVLAMIPLCLICKLFGKKLVFIESFAKVTSPTRSGRLLYHFADQFYVQWPQMLEVYPNAIYVGGIY